jgi:hypothetical protein
MNFFAEQARMYFIGAQARRPQSFFGAQARRPLYFFRRARVTLYNFFVAAQARRPKYFLGVP